MNNIEINDKLETDIENKYIKFKENVKFTTEEAIYILKRKDFCDEVENIAIENLIKENKELKKQMGKDLDEVYIKGVYDERDKWKSKVKEKIDKIQELQINYVDGITFDHIILELEELLEGE